MFQFLSLVTFFLIAPFSFGQLSPEKKEKLQSVLNKTVDGKTIFGTTFSIKKDSIQWQGASGNLTPDQSFFIASTTKLFTTAIIMKFKADGKLTLKDPISIYLDSSVLNGLHVYKGKEYSSEITIKNLLAHTSGLPDYFQDKGKNGKSLESELIHGNDQYWSFEQAMIRTKNLKPLFKPSTPGKAHYSDANFQLLGKIIEVVSKKSYSQNCEELIIRPLGLKHTYLFQDSSDKTPKCLYYKNQELHIPLAMISFGSDGGMVSNTTDLLVFIEAFFTGKLFPKHYIDEMQRWNSIFFPMKSGIGMHLFKLPSAFNPGGVIPYFLGHSGLSGALAYYSPEENLFIVGTINQVAHPDISFKTMVKLTQQILAKEN
jgi:CubicO group peptidase (beta-lactamase class C family)